MESFEEQKRLDRARKKVEAIKGFYKHLGVYLLVNISLLIADAVTTGPDEEFWTFGNFSMAIFWGLGVLFHALSVFGTGRFFGRNWEERKIQEFMEREKNKTKKWE